MAKDKLAVIIPIGDYPFLANAVLSNIKETSKIDLDIFFVTSSDYHPRLELAIQGHHLKSNLSGKNHGVHLKLIDWAMREISHDWICVQHADMFWLDNWGNQIIDQLDNNLIALTLPYEMYNGDYLFKEHKFRIGNKNLLRTHDFCGFYNRKAICDLGLSFQSGKIKDLSISNSLKLSLDKIDWIHRDYKLNEHDELDGSDLIGLEIALNWPERISEAKLKSSYNHCWGMLEVANHIEIKENTVYINKPFDKCARGLSAFSFMSSMLFDKDLMSDKVVPWSIVKNHFPKNSINEILMKYKNTNNVYGFSTNIKKIKFTDKEISRNIKMF